MIDLFAVEVALDVVIVACMGRKKNKNSTGPFISLFTLYLIVLVVAIRTEKSPVLDGASELVQLARLSRWASSWEMNFFSLFTPLKGTIPRTRQFPSVESFFILLHLSSKPWNGRHHGPTESEI